jgi:hypothetical protein
MHDKPKLEPKFEIKPKLEFKVFFCFGGFFFSECFGSTFNAESILATHDKPEFKLKFEIVFELEPHIFFGF